MSEITMEMLRKRTKDVLPHYSKFVDFVSANSPLSHILYAMYVGDNAELGIMLSVVGTKAFNDKLDVYLKHFTIASEEVKTFIEQNPAEKVDELTRLVVSDALSYIKARIRMFVSMSERQKDEDNPLTAFLNGLNTEIMTPN